MLSRVNHSCNPNAVVIVGGVGGNHNNALVLKAACDIMPGGGDYRKLLGKVPLCWLPDPSAVAAHR